MDSNTDILYALNHAVISQIVVIIRAQTNGGDSLQFKRTKVVESEVAQK